MSFSEVVVTQHWVIDCRPVEMRVEAIHHDVLEPCELRALVEKRESARLHARAPVLRGRMVGEHDEADSGEAGCTARSTSTPVPPVSLKSRTTQCGGS
jgi:hypothetical protein